MSSITFTTRIITTTNAATTMRTMTVAILHVRLMQQRECACSCCRIKIHVAWSGGGPGFGGLGRKSDVEV